MIQTSNLRIRVFICALLSYLAINTACRPVTFPTSTVTPITSIQPSITPSPTITPTPTLPPLPEGINTQIIDGVKAEAQRDHQLHTWVWRNKAGDVRRLLDPFSQHILVKTSSLQDRLSYEVDLYFLWEVNLVNYLHYAPHAPFGTGYIQLLKAKYPHILSKGDENTGIVFRIMHGALTDITDKSSVTYFSDAGTSEERVFLAPVYNPDTNEYTFTMFISSDFLTRKAALNTYTDWMLNYCVSGEYPQNPSGAWGIQLYKHPIKK